ncbi:MAG: N-acetyltransferase, partial [Moraxellaceae bacterium]
MHIVLETPRLFLRRFTASEEDAALLLQLNSDPEVLQYLHEPLLHDLEHAHQVLTNIMLPQYELNLGRWAMHLKDDGRFLGWCGLKWLADRQEVD